MVAKHEVGHALVGTALTKFLQFQAPVNKLSIIPLVGGALGFTYTPPNTEDRSLLFNDEIRGRLSLLMGGRAAEELTCEQVSTGAVDDIKRATDLARQAIVQLGINEAIGPINIDVLADY